MIRLPPSIQRLILLLVLAAPLISTLAEAAAAAAAGDKTTDKLQARRPQPSRRMGAQKRNKKVEPLKKKDYSSFLCPGGSIACPISDEVTSDSISRLENSLNSLADWFKVGFECVELDTELNSCGGCLALGSGQDCSLIANARATGCEAGTCQVYSCFDGYVVSPDRQTCVKKGTTTPATPITAVGLEDADQVVLLR
ncbi:uncharacterized protein I303_100971 [Kwoniella dejecticola CBS 10117]|uniref:Protein CPL1-like domain-containing protein n=1 Tax=Kwoniella dejecticola CBS 10117 TaxID=1296121 RepID=A0A1A6AGK5_9TREE|nr:uncharacterized protein I303_00975 [Kwoniella dejecticola CBS 10117]OBR89153.1 hypothetical protein I303_00975 [Kwoniella dejecticola CBS 10117]